MVVVCTDSRTNVWNTRIMSLFKHIWSEVLLGWRVIKLLHNGHYSLSMSIPGHSSKVS